MASLTIEGLRSGYESLFGTMKIKAGRLQDADDIVTKIANHKSVYETIMEATGVPWQIVGIFHSLEGDLNFNTHLHNGDPLTKRTVHVPKNRPTTGNPPFTFAASAIDALTFDGLANRKVWGLGETLFRLEKFNGFGYRNAAIGINTPYLWSFSNKYTKGKFGDDGHYSAELVSKQCGGAVLLRRMIDREIFAFEGLPQEATVFVDGVKRNKVTAFVHKGNSWIAPRPLTQFVPGLSVAAVSNNPLRVTLEFRDPADNDAVTTRSFEGRMFHNNGHVDASALVRDFLGKTLDFDSNSSPSRLLIS